ncbi:MAG: ESX-1 secretion-associated protein [Mycobacterium sp.]|nr:ESX-1 secretion-associated protein [Mycobacterium sp.]
MGTTSVDLATLDAAAQRLDAAAEIVQNASNVRLQFDGAVAGRSHTAAGAAVRNAVESLIADARRWASTAGEAASALRAGVNLAAHAEADSAAALR